MEGGVLPLSTVLGNPSEPFMDFDYMDELFLDVCWLDAERSDFPRFDHTPPVSPFEWPTLEFSNGELGGSPSKFGEEERLKSSFPEKLSISESRRPQHYKKPNSDSENLSNNPVVSSSQCVDYSVEGSEQSKRWWIRPKASVMERLIQALGCMQICSGDKDVLIQVWVPVTREGKRVLTTNNQPFSVDLNCPKLAHYREISAKYDFPADEDSKEVVGLPGRVYRNKVPEWTPDVRFFSWEEYPRVAHAQQYDVRGTLAVPILEQGTRNCLGVIEVILTTQKIQYRPELESVCKALEAVDLSSPEVSNTQKVKASDSSYQAALPEIRNVLRSACETHNLPLAQTWVPCSNGGCWNSDDNSKNFIAPIESACYVGDSRIKGFHEACYEYQLLKGQGIVGRAFQTNQPCFSADVSACSKTDYPLSHHARMFGLKAAVAIRLRSISTGSADFVLEFFLPTKCSSPDEHEAVLTSLSSIIQSVCRTLRVVTDKELEEETDVEGREMSVEGAEIRLGQRDSSSSKTVAKRRVKADQTITLQVLRQHFAGSLKDAAKNLGVCPTTLKRICRQLGIQRWPSRKIKKVGHSLQKIQRVTNSVQGASAGLQIESFYSSFPELASPNGTRTTKTDNNLNPSESQPNNNLSTPLAPPTASLSPSSSSSSQCCSSGANQSSSSFNAGGEDNTEEPANGTLKRARSDANIHLRSDVSFCWPENQENCGERDGRRIKVTHGEDTIRFKMQSDWRYIDLLHEISRRFGVGDSGGYHLKYLDDDSEWVLLSCDADLEECVDVCGLSKTKAIRLSFLHASQLQVGRDGCLRAPSSFYKEPRNG